jgi:RNA polymerase sigma-70 factor (ECF subfamily)
MSNLTEQLWHSLAAQLRSFIIGRIGNPAVAEDVLQDVFMKLHEKLPSLREADRIEAWVWRITRNALADHLRRQRPTEELPADLRNADREPDLPDLRPALRQFLAALPPEDREALELTEFHGLKQEELAARLGLSLSGAKSRVQRARARLRAEFEACCRLDFDQRGRVIECEARQPDKGACECG